MSSSKWAIKGVGAVAVAALAQTIAPIAAHAGADKTALTRKTTDATPVKDCTRLNARYGYYANPWCTAVEQARWDRWEAARLKAR